MKYSLLKKVVVPAVVSALVGLLALPQGAVANPVTIYWTDRDNATLNKTDVGGGGTTQLVGPTGGRLQDVDLSGGKLYFTDWGPVGAPGGEGTINQVNTDGTGLATVFTTGDGVHQLAIDQALQRIYFTRAVSYDNHEVSYVGTNGLGYTALFGPFGFGGPGWFPSGLALDAANSKLYWGDIGVLSGNPPDGTVNSMNTDGTGQTPLQPHVDGLGRGFALDPTFGAGGTIFLTQHDPASPATNGGLWVYDITLDTLTQLINDPSTGYWDVELDTVAQRVYWTEYATGLVRSAKYDGTDIQTVLSGLSNPYGLALDFAAPPVPEPGTFALLALGGLVALGMRVRHRKR